MKKILLVIVLFIAAMLLTYKNFVVSTPENTAANKQAGQAFLEENGQKSEVITTETGLQYQVLTEGDGSRNPGSEDVVEVHYHGSLIDGTVFDSSVDRGDSIRFALNQVIPGWTEGLQLMNTGDKYRFFIPSDLAYGDRGTGSIPGGSVLIFDVELIKIK